MAQVVVSFVSAPVIQAVALAVDVYSFVAVTVRAAGNGVIARTATSPHFVGVNAGDVNPLPVVLVVIVRVMNSPDVPEHAPPTSARKQYEVSSMSPPTSTAPS